MIPPLLEDTIAAVATPMGVGAISVIRVSGPKAISAADSIFVGKISIAKAKSHTVHYGKVIDKNKNVIDDVLLTKFTGPYSYTGEDVVEISFHGNPLIAQKIMGVLLFNGIRIAEPGEFTKRAFLNNKMDLVRAEAVADTILSRSEASLRGARNQLDGVLSNSVEELRGSLLEVLSLLELELDFTEEEIEFIKRNELIEKIESIVKKLDSLIGTYDIGRVIRDGVNVAIIGKPNVGKSSLLNYLLKESRAIVSEIPGTTRDIIREEISIDGILFKLFDTAGMRFSTDQIESEGVRRSREAIRNADIVLLISDVEQGFAFDLFQETASIIGENRIVKVMNKIDIQKAVHEVEQVEISVKTGEGIAELINKLKNAVFTNANYSEKSIIVTNSRHLNCLRLAKKSLSSAVSSLNSGLSNEFVAVDLRDSVSHLGEIIGEITSDDLLNSIFSKFCIGK